MILPAYDMHFRMIDFRSYQIETYESAMKHVTNKGCAVDAGAHIGIFTKRMAKDFNEVWSFEPQPDNFICLKRNCQEPNVHPIPAALWDAVSLVQMVTPKKENSGAWECMPCGKIQAVPLDYYELDDVGLIKIDVQGSEGAVLDGAAKTIEKWKPVLIVENANAEQLEKMGYRMVEQIKKDGIFVA